MSASQSHADQQPSATEMSCWDGDKMSVRFSLSPLLVSRSPPLGSTYTSMTIAPSVDSLRLRGNSNSRQNYLQIPIPRSTQNKACYSSPSSLWPFPPPH